MNVKRTVSHDILRQKSLIMTEKVFLDEFKGYFEQSLGIPVFFPNSNSSIIQLCNYIIDYLSN